MPRKSDLVKSAEAEISRLKINIRKLEEQVFKQRAEIKAYENMIQWVNQVTAKAKEKVK